MTTISHIELSTQTLSLMVRTWGNHLNWGCVIQFHRSIDLIIDPGGGYDISVSPLSLRDNSQRVEIAKMSQWSSLIHSEQTVDDANASNWLSLYHKWYVISSSEFWECLSAKHCRAHFETTFVTLVLTSGFHNTLFFLSGFSKVYRQKLQADGRCHWNVDFITQFRKSLRKKLSHSFFASISSVRDLLVQPDQLWTHW